jgi:hypothetical protein
MTQISATDASLRGRAGGTAKARLFDNSHCEDAKAHGDTYIARWPSLLGDQHLSHATAE